VDEWTAEIGGWVRRSLCTRVNTQTRCSTVHIIIKQWCQLLHSVLLTTPVYDGHWRQQQKRLKDKQLLLDAEHETYTRSLYRGWVHDSWATGI